MQMITKSFYGSSSQQVAATGFGSFQEFTRSAESYHMLPRACTSIVHRTKCFHCTGCMKQLVRKDRRAGRSRETCLCHRKRAEAYRIDVRRSIHLYFPVVCRSSMHLNGRRSPFVIVSLFIRAGGDQRISAAPSKTRAAALWNAAACSSVERSGTNMVWKG